MSAVPPVAKPIVPFQPPATLSVQYDKKGWGGGSAFLVEFDKGQPSKIGPGYGELKPLSQASKKELAALPALVRAAQILETANFPQFNTREYRNRFSNPLRDGEFIITLSHWPGAPRSIESVMGHVKDLSGAPAAVVDAVKALDALK